MFKYSGTWSYGKLQFYITDSPMFAQACDCKLRQRYITSAFVVDTIIEAENFVAERGRPMTIVGPFGDGGGHSINRFETCGDQVFNDFGAIGTYKILVFKTQVWMKQN